MENTIDTDYIEKIYRLGNDLNEFIKQQDPGLTPFGHTFTKMFFCETGIDVKFCHLMYFGTAFNVLMWYNENCGICRAEAGCQLAEQYQKTAERLFFESASQLGFPSLTKNQKLIFRMDPYFEYARMRYMSFYTEHLNHCLRQRFPEVDVTMFWRYEQPYYLLLFRTSSDVPDNATIGAIKDCIDSMCRENDKLGLFTGYHSSPIVSDFETMRHDLMGILLNNTWYGGECL